MFCRATLYVYPTVRRFPNERANAVVWHETAKREQSEPGEVTGKGKQQPVTEPLTINPKSTLGWNGNVSMLSEMGLPAHHTWDFTLDQAIKPNILND